MTIELRPWQLEAINALRDGIRQGHRCQMLVAPTGAGKTYCSAYLLQETQAKGNRAAFLVDRVALTSQTSRALWDFGIQHGVAQGQNTFGRQEPIQVCSQQTIEKRGFFPHDLSLICVDEAHTQRKMITEYLQKTDAYVIGLTATPFTAGLGKTYTNVVNVTTTNQLINDGILAPLKVYAAKEIDMAGAKTVGGEWTDREVASRGKRIIGDIVSEWVDKVHKHFGRPVKTLVFSATVDHGEEICRQFQAAGYNFQQVSYKDGNDERRADLLREFGEPNSDIVGVTSVDALCKGFDQPDVLCLICARPFRKSFASHIQMIGRAMRSHPGKDFALLLDHSGNYLGFMDQMEDLFENGVSALDDGKHQNSVRKDVQKESSDIRCSCGFVMKPSMTACPACGKERPRKNRVENVAGELVELNGKRKKPVKPYLENPEEAWRQLCTITLERKKGDQQQAERMALAQFKNFYGGFPAEIVGRKMPFSPADHVDPRLRSHVTANVIRYWKAQEKQRRRA